MFTWQLFTQLLAEPLLGAAGSSLQAPPATRKPSRRRPPTRPAAPHGERTLAQQPSVHRNSFVRVAILTGAGGLADGPKPTLWLAKDGESMRSAVVLKDSRLVPLNENAQACFILGPSLQLQTTQRHFNVTTSMQSIAKLSR